MTVSSTNAVSGPYVANGSTTVFPFTFKAMTAGEVRVTIVEDETETEQSDTLYTVTLSTGGGNVTFADAPASGDVYIYSEPAFTQETGFSSGQQYSPTVVNEALDRAAVRDQYLRRVVLAALDAADAGVVGDIRSELASPNTGKGAGLIGVENGGTVQDRLDEIVTLRPTMSATDINTALSALTNGGTVHAQPGTYTMTAAVTGIQSNTKIKAEGATWDFSGVDYGTRINVLGSLGTPVALSSNATAATSTLVLSSVAGLSVGDLLLVYSDALVPLDAIGGTTTETIGEIVTIEAISGTTVTTFEVLDDSYLTADNAVAAKITPKENITIEGLTVIGKGEPGDTSSTLENGIAGKYVRNLNVVNCNVKYCDYNGIRFEQAIGCSAIGNTVEFEERGGTSGSAFIQYGIAYLSAIRDLTIERNTILGGKHAIAQSENSDPGMGRHIKIRHNLAKQTWAAAYATHESCAAIDFFDNDTEGCARGYDIRVPYVTIRGGNIRGLDPSSSIGDAVYLSENAHDVEISGLWVYGGRYGVRLYNSGIYAGSNPKNINIHDNHFLNIGQRPIYLQQTLTSTAIKGLVVSDNEMPDFGADGIYLDGPFLRPTIKGNVLECASAPAGYGVRLLGTQKGSVRGNTFIGMVPVRLENDTQGVPVTPSLNMLYGNSWDHTTAFLSQVAGTFTMQQDNVQIGPNSVTIASGVATVPAGHKYIIIDTEGAGATDDLDTISGAATGDTMTFRAASGARTVVFKDGTGNLKLSGDITLDNDEDTITLTFHGTNWLQNAASGNGA